MASPAPATAVSRPDDLNGLRLGRFVPLDAAARRAAVEAFDLRALDRAFLDDPYPVYHLLRPYAPVRQMPDGSYFLTRYHDLHAVIGRAHVCTPVTNAHLVCRLLLEIKHNRDRLIRPLT